MPLSPCVSFSPDWVAWLLHPIACKTRGDSSAPHFKSSSTVALPEHLRSHLGKDSARPIQERSSDCRKAPVMCHFHLIKKVTPYCLYNQPGNG